MSSFRARTACDECSQCTAIAAEARETSPIARTGLVVIGASAGGPVAIARVLAGLPRSFPAPIILVQHLIQELAPLLAEWIAATSAFRVRLATPGEPLEPGTAVLIGREQNVRMRRDGTLDYTPSNGCDCSYRPCINAFLFGLARIGANDVAAVLLTGMGRDGAQGMLELRRNGGLTIAQDQNTSAVFGMPKAAAQIAAAREILPLRAIPARLVQWAEKRGPK